MSQVSASGKMKIQLKPHSHLSPTSNTVGLWAPTKVVCVKVNQIRPQYQNLKEWMNDPLNVYIGRRGIVFIDNVRFPKEDSIWANPYKVGRDGTREEVIAKYKNHITHLISSNQITKDQLLSLKGKILGCWCKPEPCHGDVLVELITECMI